ncbi:MAG: hypothetical protein ACI3VB_07320 [Oscillospiraceae bacterium]
MGCIGARNRTVKGRYEARSIAWMNAVRKYNNTQTIFDDNPHSEVYKYRDNVYAILNNALDGEYDRWSYLIIGPKKAMLIDTGWGLGDLKKVCERLTDKELVVVNTDGRLYHAGGNCLFDKVYCHKNDVKLLEGQSADSWNRMFNDNGEGIYLDVTKADVVEYKKYDIIPCEDGHEFDLGEGYKITLLWLPGATSGSAVYLDEQNRILFSGDSLRTTYMHIGIDELAGELIPKAPEEYCTVKAYSDGINRVFARIDKIDFLFPGQFIIDIESFIIEDMVNCCKAILELPDKTDRTLLLKNGETAKFRYAWAPGMVVYLDRNVV